MIRSRRRRALAVALAVLGLLAAVLSPRQASAQCPESVAASGGGICGTVRAVGGGPVAGARIRADNGVEVLSDSAGRFAIAGVSAPSVRLGVRAIGYTPVALSVTRPASGGAATVEIQLEPFVSRLAPTIIEGTRFTATRRDFDGFEERRKAGRGYFLDDAQLRRFAPASVADIFSAVPGLRVPTRGGALLSTRGRDDRGRPCRPAVYLDGGYVPNVELLATLVPSDVIGVEVYHSNPPMIFRAPNTQFCTASVVLWTRLARPRR